MGELAIATGWDSAITPSTDNLVNIAPAGATNLVGRFYFTSEYETLHFYASAPEFASNDVGTIGATVTQEGYSVVTWRFDIMSEVAFNYARTTYSGKMTAQTPIWGNEDYTRRNVRSRLFAPTESIVCYDVKWFLNVEWELQYRENSA